MRFIGSALVMSAIVLGACGGGEKAPAADSAAAAAPAVAATGTAAPITGTTHEVKMYGDPKTGFKFEPKDITIKAGDGIKFIVADLGPHNVAFAEADIPADVRPQLDANMGAATEKIGFMSTKLVMTAGDFVVISFANIKPGTYPFNCTPHLPMGMKGTVTVQ
jgi:plastocyanin